MELRKSKNPWTRWSDSQEECSEEDQKTTELYRRFQGILNKLTPQKFQSLAEQALLLEINTEERLKGVIDKIFTSALEGPRFSIAYANLCKVLSPTNVEWTTPDGKQKTNNFCCVLLTKCQQELEKDEKDDEEREWMLQMIKDADTEEKKQQLREELSDIETKLRQRSRRNIGFIGELFKLKMLSETIIHKCIVRLLRSPIDEEALECFARLLTTTGKDLDHPQAKQLMDKYFDHVAEIIKKSKVPSRIYFMLQDLQDLRANNWVQHSRQESSLKTIDQIHAEAWAEEAVQKQLIQQRHGMMVPMKQVPTLVDLVSELQDVSDWITFGLYLGIKIWQLRAIEMDFPTTEERRARMLFEWMKNATPTWSAVVQALVGIRMRRRASEVARKHGIAPPKLPDDERLEQLKNIPQQEEHSSQCASLTVNIVPELVDLVSELQDVNDWILFGVHLGIKIKRLRAIEMDYSTFHECLTKMLEEWLNKVTPTWSAVVQALVETGRIQLATELALKHRIAPPKLPVDEPLEQSTNIPQQEEHTSQCAIATPELLDLVSELQDVNDWIPFGFYLGIEMERLIGIAIGYSTIQERLTKMLEEWQTYMTPTWSTVVQALVGIGRAQLASRLAQKHGIAFSKLPIDEPLEQLTNIPQQEEHTSQVPTLRDLVSELQDVYNWMPFGLYLGIKFQVLRAIRSQYQTVQECRVEMLKEWQKNVIPTWSTVVQALVGIGMIRHASELAKEHGIALPKLPGDEPLEQLKVIPQEEEATGSSLLKFQKHTAPELLDLVSELQDVNNWMSLGLFLGISPPRIKEIRHNCRTTEECRIEMLNTWQMCVTPTWSAVVQAFVGIGMTRRASELAKKHGIDLPKLPGDEPLEQLKVIPQEEEATGSSLLKFQKHTAPDILDLVDELQDVYNWIPFGLSLGFPSSILEDIRQKCQTTEHCRIEMLHRWRRHVTPTWSAVVQAFVGIGMTRRASELAKKHGIALPKLPGDEPLEQLRVIPQEEEATGFSLLKFQKHTAPELLDLVDELQDVNDWIPFGLSLGIPPPILVDIRHNCRTTEECRIEMLITCQMCVTPTWSAVVQALVGIGKTRHASELAKKHVRPPHHEFDAKYPEVCFFGDTRHEIVSSEGKVIEWEDIGVTIDIPPGAVYEQVVSVRPCLSGPFEIPDGIDLASPLHLVGPAFTFRQEIKLSLQHFINLETPEDCEQMTFLSAPSTPSYIGFQPTYLLREIKIQEGTFAGGNQVATILLKHFCAVGVGRKRIHPAREGDSAKRIKRNNIYSVRLYWNWHSLSGGQQTNFAVFAVCLCHPLHVKNLEKLMEQHFGKKRLLTKQEPLCLSGDLISLRVPKNVPGWKISADRTTKISKSELDLPLHAPEYARFSGYPPTIHLTISHMLPSAREQTVLIETDCKLKVIGLNEKVEFCLPLPRASVEPVAVMSSTVPSASEIRLREKDLDFLTDILKGAVTKWKKIGLALGFLDTELTAVERKPLLVSEGDSGYFRMILSKWLNWAPTNHNHPWPTIEALTLALKKAEEERLAYYLKEKYLKQCGECRVDD